MEEKLVEYIKENNLSLFNTTKKTIKTINETPFKTKEAKSIHTKIINQLSNNFFFKETTNVWNLFPFTKEYKKIQQRQEFFKTLTTKNIEKLTKITKPRAKWNPPYDIIAVTEDEQTFVELNKLGCPTQLIINQNDILDLERADIVQVIHCDNYQTLLEKLPQTVFIDNIENIYLERYLEQLSGWKENINILQEIKKELTTPTQNIITELTTLLTLLQNKESKIITEEHIEKKVEEINEHIKEKIKELTITGEGLMKMLGEGKIPEPLLNIIRKEIEQTNINEHLFNIQIPVTIDQQELEEQIKRQSANEHTTIAENIKKEAHNIKKIPKKLQELEARIIIEDFCNGINKWITKEKHHYPKESTTLEMIDNKNNLIKNPEPISFQLNENTTCSILTGANSGGKTTLLEHIIQNTSLLQLGLPTKGTFTTPLFENIYYFAKNKGSASKGAFETLLTQLASINTEKQTLILADEIEAVTEPGIAGEIIAATAQYFITKKCYLILATHLGQEIQKNLPTKARIDGIEAKGLNKNYELIINHNPILGKLAHSTPELIIEKMAQTTKKDYLTYIKKSIEEKDQV